MKGQINSIHGLPELIAIAQIDKLEELAAPRFQTPAEPAEEEPILHEARLWVGLPSAELRTGEFLETLGYAVIWLCGCLGIVLSFG